MRYDGKKTKRRATKMTIKELSGVTRGAHEGADVTIMKFQNTDDDAAMQLVKSAYSEALREQVAEQTVREHMEPLWQYNWALREAAEKILTDSEITDKQTAMRESVMEYLNSVLALFSTTQEAEPMANDNTELETLKSELATAKADLATATALSKMSDASKAHYNSLTTDEDRDSFVKMSAADQEDLVKLSQEPEETYKMADGTTLSKADAGKMYDTIKAQDQAMRQMRDEQAFSKARETVTADIPNVPGEMVTKAKAYQSLNALPEAERKWVSDTLKAADALWKERKDPAGTPEGGSDDGSPEAKLDNMAKAHATESKTSYEQAYAAVIKTADGQALLNQMEA